MAAVTITFFFISTPPLLCRTDGFCLFAFCCLRNARKCIREGIQRKDFGNSASAVYDYLHPRQDILHGFKKHSLLGHLRILLVFLVHRLESGNLGLSLIDPGLLLGLCIAAGFVYSLVTAPVAHLLIGEPITESILASLLVTLILIIYFALTIPLTYAFGPDKARSAMLLLVGVAGGSILAASSLGGGAESVLNGLFGWMETSPVPGFSIITAATVVICLVCWLVSCRIYEKKEF